MFCAAEQSAAIKMRSILILRSSIICAANYYSTLGLGRSPKPDKGCAERNRLIISLPQGPGALEEEVNHLRKGIYATVIEAREGLYN